MRHTGVNGGQTPGWIAGELRGRPGDTRHTPRPPNPRTPAQLGLKRPKRQEWLCLDLSDDGLLYDSYAMTRPEQSTLNDTDGDVRTAFLRSLANSIEGGTSDIMRDILGERVLGLPREPSTP